MSALSALPPPSASRPIADTPEPALSYLLSSHPPPLDAHGGPVAPRVHLYGASPSLPASQLQDAIILTELVEFALSLVPLVKGQEPFSGLASLQAYRLVHAAQLAEVGDTITAQRSD